jgi:diaminopimelate decarboxylase
VKPIYERPILVRHEPGMMNKFSRVQATRPLENIDGLPVAKLVAEFGSPLFVFSERTLVDRYQELEDAFRRRYPRFRVAWSYKTNYLGAICKVLHKEGAYAEVVSEFEWEKARSLGVPGDRIHFNGPFKPEATLERVLPEGTIVHLDHFDEMLAAERLAERRELRPQVALRLNIAADGAPHWSRFGFNLESGQATDAVMRLVSGDRLELAGLHCHLGTFILDPGIYRQAAKKLAEFANQIRDRFGLRLSFIDLGGGFASHNTLKAQYLPGEQATPAFARYAEAIADGLSALRYAPSEMPTLVVEHGRALVDDAGYLVSSVVANKRLPDGRRGVVVDAGVNVLFTSFWYKHDVVPAQPTHGLPEPTVLYGPLCMNIDVVREALLFPPVDVGDRLVFRNVGAYNVTQWMQFITYRPAVVMIARDGQVSLIRRRETLESITREEVLPEWLV